MLLALAATEFEMEPFLRLQDWQGAGCVTLLTGVGPVETGVRLARYLSENAGKVDGVVNFGVAGAYIGSGTGRKCSLLDICLASQEVFGDFGICFADTVEPLAKEITGQTTFEMDTILLRRAELLLAKHHLSSLTGVFVTVNGVSGTRLRGDMLQKRHDGLCENMEGAAVARVCAEFSLPLLEVRCISNFVEDRDVGRWKLKEASEKSAETAALLIQEMHTRQ